MVLRLFEADKDLVRVKGREGYTPLHEVAKRGNLSLLAQFLVDCPACVRDVTTRDETALHVAANNHQLEALRVLTQLLRRTYFYSSTLGKKLLNWKDKDGDTVLHAAASNASNNIPEMVRLLLDCKVKMNEVNSNGKTALDILQELKMPDYAAKRKAATDILLNAEGLNASSIPRIQPLHVLLRSKITFFERAFGEVFHDITNMSAEKSSAVLVILVLILTSTYQATLSPPGGVLQGDSGNNTTNSTSSIEGKSALSSASFFLFYVPNTIAFIITLILTLGLLAMVASGITTLLLVPLLLLYFCLLSSTFDISPNSAVLIFGFLPFLSLPIILRVIGHTKSLRKYMAEKV
ncbi:hypothetical protein PTKIN_Ptkin16aG0499500 [Pterospermum kingtungense]